MPTCESPARGARHTDRGNGARWPRPRRYRGAARPAWCRAGPGPGEAFPPAARAFCRRPAGRDRHPGNRDARFPGRDADSRQHALRPERGAPGAGLGPPLRLLRHVVAARAVPQPDRRGGRTAPAGAGHCRAGLRAAPTGRAARLGATLAMAPVLLSAYAVQLEHFVMSDTLFAALVMIAIALIMWWPDPPLWACAVTGMPLPPAGTGRPLPGALRPGQGAVMVQSYAHRLLTGPTRIRAVRQGVGAGWLVRRPALARFSAGSGCSLSRGPRLGAPRPSSPMSRTRLPIPTSRFPTAGTGSATSRSRLSSRPRETRS